LFTLDRTFNDAGPSNLNCFVAFCLRSSAFEFGKPWVPIFSENCIHGLGDGSGPLPRACLYQAQNPGVRSKHLKTNLTFQVNGNLLPSIDPLLVYFYVQSAVSLGRILVDFHTKNNGSCPESIYGPMAESRSPHHTPSKRENYSLLQGKI
jgi:hypothetical protein